MGKNVYSLASVTLDISNPNYDEKLSIGGNGALLGTVEYSFNNNLFTIESSADGGSAVSFNNSLAGAVSISLTQTSAKIEKLIKFILWCRENPTEAESTITCYDVANNINFVARGVFPTKIPGNSVSERIGSRRFDFGACEIVVGGGV